MKGESGNSTLNIQGAWEFTSKTRSLSAATDLAWAVLASGAGSYIQAGDSSL